MEGPPDDLPTFTSGTIFNNFTGLQPNTTYHYKVTYDIGNNGSVDIDAGDRTFTTLGAPVSMAVSGIGATTTGAANTVTVTVKDAQGTTATTYRGKVHFTSDDPNAVLPPDYTFNATDNGSHQFSSAVKFMNPGTRSVTARDVANGSIGGTQSGISVGGSAITPPTASITALPKWKAATTIALAWGGASGAVSYDVQYRKAAYSGAFGAPVTYLSATAATSAPFTAAPGTTYCWSVRSRSAAGAVSAFTDETCTTIPLDERSTTKTGTWTSGTGAAYYKATYFSSTALNAKLTRTGAKFNQLLLVATTCPTCGKVSVYLGPTLLKTVSLVSATTVNKKIIPIFTQAEVPSGTPLKAGTVVVKVVTSGKKVLIDGLIFSRYAQ